MKCKHDMIGNHVIREFENGTYLGCIGGEPTFDGGTDPQGVEGYVPDQDDARLAGQLERVIYHMFDRAGLVFVAGSWQTLEEISDAIHDPHASVSAQLRHLRKERFGNHVVEKRSRGERSNGLWEYRLLWNTDSPLPKRREN